MQEAAGLPSTAVRCFLDTVQKTNTCLRDIRRISMGKAAMPHIFGRGFRNRAEYLYCHGDDSEQEQACGANIRFMPGRIKPQADIWP